LYCDTKQVLHNISIIKIANVCDQGNLDMQLFCATETLTQHKSLQTKQNIWTQICCWHWCSILTYVTCVLHLMAPITQYSKLRHSTHYQVLQQIVQNYPRSSNLDAAFQVVKNV